MLPFKELKAMAFWGFTREKVTKTRPFKACATALPETLFNVTEPFTSLTSNSPSTPVTTMSLGVHGTQLEGSVIGNGNGQVDGARERIGGDAHFVVFFFHGKVRSRNRDALHG